MLPQPAVRGRFRGEAASAAGAEVEKRVADVGHRERIVPEYHRTFGELPPALKAVISHRARAMRAIMPAIVRSLASG